MQELLPLLRSARSAADSKARVVCVSSVMHWFVVEAGQHADWRHIAYPPSVHHQNSLDAYNVAK